MSATVSPASVDGRQAGIESEAKRVAEQAPTDLALADPGYAGRRSMMSLGSVVMRELPSVSGVNRGM